MKKQYMIPQVEDIQMDDLMDNLGIAQVSNVQVQDADAPSRGGAFFPL